MKGKSVFEFLGGRPALVDGFLMARGIRADALGFVYGDREMHAQVAVEVVVGEVLRGVRYVVGGADVGLAIREGVLPPNALSMMAVSSAVAGSASICASLVMMRSFQE